MKFPHLSPLFALATTFTTILAHAQNPPNPPPPPFPNQSHQLPGDPPRPDRLDDHASDPLPGAPGPNRGPGPEHDRPAGRSGVDRLPEPNRLARRTPPDDAPARPQAFLGVVTTPLDPALSAQLGLTEGVGLLVQEVLPEGPAMQAGLQKHDVLTQLNDQMLLSPDQLSTLIRHYGKDQNVTLKLVRKGVEQTLTVRIGERVLAERRPLDFGSFGGMLRQLPRNLPDARRDLEKLQERVQEQSREIQKRAREFQERAQDMMKRPEGASAPARPSGPDTSGGHGTVPPVDLLRQVGPEGAPEVKVHNNNFSTTWNTSSARVVLKDDAGEIEVSAENGQRTLVARNAKGEEVFKGPINTEEERAAVPPEFREKLKQVEVNITTGPVQSKGNGRSGSDPIGGKKPAQPQPAASDREPHVQ